MLHRSLIALAIVGATVIGCGPSPEEGAPPPPVAPEPRIDPVTAALSGSARRALERRHPNAHVIVFDEVINRDGVEPWLCGRALLLTRRTRREQIFMASTTDMVELRKTTDRRWMDTCTTATPVPGGLDAVEAGKEAAKLTYD